MAPGSTKVGVETNLTPDANAFVGRDAELLTVEDELRGPGVITLVGPPGTGKTRLSRELARRAVDRGTPSGGVFFCDLTEARDLDGFCAVLARTLGVRLSVLDPTVPAGDALVEQLGYAIESRDETLLVLDNFEQVLDAADAVDALRTIAPEARLLVTSREPLRIRDERPIDLDPLPCPAADASPEEAMASPAVQLLLARASHLTLDDETAMQAGAIVRELDGIPLAIELAAARLRSLGPADLLERMHRRLDVLGRGPRGAQARQATLRGALDWSWDLLDDSERRAIAEASVFAGGFSADAAEAILSADDSDPLDLLISLADKSLVRRLPGPGGHARYALFESVRSWAAEKLDSLAGQPVGPDELRDRHATWFAAEAEQRPWAWRALELPNLLSAIDHATTRGDRLTRARLLLAADPVLSVSGPHESHDRLLTAAAEDDVTSLPASLRARLLACRGRAASRRARLDAAGAAFDLAVVAVAEVEDDVVAAPLRADVLADRAQLEQARGNLEAAATHLDEALALLRDDEDAAVRARVLHRLGLLHHGRGALDEARVAYEEALVLARAVDDRSIEAALLVQIASLRLQQGRLDEAQERYREALRIAEALSDPITVGLVEGNLGILEQEKGELDTARDHFERGATSLRRGGARLFEAHLLGYLGALLHEQRELAGAVDRYRESIAILARVGDRRLEGVFRAALGAAEAGRDRISAAAEQLDAAREALDTIGDPGLSLALGLHEAQLELARARAADAAGDRRRAAELRASVEDAVARANADDAMKSSDDARLALRLLDDARTHRALVVGPGIEWLRPPTGERIDLGQRANLHRIVAAFVEARRDTPGRPLTIDDILEAGWPGERVRFDAGRNRVKVALSTLRKLGLRDVLVRHDDGYLLSTDIPLIDEGD